MSAGSAAVRPNRRCPVGEEPPGSLVLQLQRGAGWQERRRLADWLEAMLPHCSWRTQVLLLDDPLSPAPAAAGAVIGTLVRHLEQQPLAGIALRPVVSLQPERRLNRKHWQPLLAAVRPFQREGYEQQTESRLAVLPIIFLPAAVLDSALEHIGWLHDSLAVPTLVIAGEPDPEPLSELHHRGLEVHCLPAHPERAVGSATVACWLRAMTVLEGLRERLDARDAGGEPALLEPCPRHLVIDQENATLSPCLRAWQEHEPVAAADPAAALPDGLHVALSAVSCSDCLVDSALAISDQPAGGQAQGEVGRVCFRLSQLLAERRQHRQAVHLAHRAYECSSNDHDRAAALVAQGLCHLDCGELPRAESALAVAAQCSDDPGLVAFHRGRVQLAWHDEIEALDRFEEALELGSPAVSPPQLHFTMALCHINLEEYSDARPHLDQAGGVDDLVVPVLFYRGVCDLNEGSVEMALATFETALQHGPSAADLGRVLFYLATCHKELGQLERAIELLQQAIAADPEDLANHNLLGYCFYALKRHEEAVASFLRAVTIDPGSAIDWANLGSNLRELGRTDEAIMMYRKALSLDPTIGFAAASLKRLTAPGE